jgi:hypothetical protein
MTWIDELLQRNAHTAYLRHYGSPRRIDELPVVTYDDLRPWIERIRDGEPDVLFAGRPVAYERTSGSTGASKLIPYSIEGLHDVRRAVEPWIRRVMSGITGSVYLALSPATRAPEFINGIPVGLPDSAYVGVFKPAVPPEVALIEDVELWRAETVRHLAVARDLELISVWSPTFLLRLLDEFDFDWPDLKIISCWASGASKPYAEELARRFPHARIEPKGLMSTECVVTVPGIGLNPYGHFEFEQGEVIATTASGLYRYRTGDYVNEKPRIRGPRESRVRSRGRKTDRAVRELLPGACSRFPLSRAGWQRVRSARRNAHRHRSNRTASLRKPSIRLRPQTRPIAAITTRHARQSPDRYIRCPTRPRRTPRRHQTGGTGDLMKIAS